VQPIRTFILIIQILKEEFLEPLNISAYRLARETNLDQTRISEIIHKKRSIAADTALSWQSSLEIPHNSGWVFRMIMISLSYCTGYTEYAE